MSEAGQWSFWAALSGRRDFQTQGLCETLQVVSCTQGLVVTSATLVVTSALLVVTKSY